MILSLGPVARLPEYCYNLLGRSGDPRWFSRVFLPVMISRCFRPAGPDLRGPDLQAHFKYGGDLGSTGIVCVQAACRGCHGLVKPVAQNVSADEPVALAA